MAREFLVGLVPSRTGRPSRHLAGCSPLSYSPNLPLPLTSWRLHRESRLATTALRLEGSSVRGGFRRDEGQPAPRVHPLVLLHRGLSTISPRLLGYGERPMRNETRRSRIGRPPLSYPSEGGEALATRELRDQIGEQSNQFQQPPS